VELARDLDRTTSSPSGVEHEQAVAVWPRRHGVVRADGSLDAIRDRLRSRSAPACRRAAALARLRADGHDCGGADPLGGARTSQPPCSTRRRPGPEAATSDRGHVLDDAAFELAPLAAWPRMSKATEPCVREAGRREVEVFSFWDVGAWQTTTPPSAGPSGR